MAPDSDPTAVVDDQFRVRGIEGLRVVDASIMPTMPSANLNAPVADDRREGGRHDPRQAGPRGGGAEGLSDGRRRREPAVGAVSQLVPAT